MPIKELIHTNETKYFHRFISKYEDSFCPSDPKIKKEENPNESVPTSVKKGNLNPHSSDMSNV